MIATLKKGTPDVLILTGYDNNWNDVTSQLNITGECTYAFRDGKLFVEGFGEGKNSAGDTVERNFSEVVEQYVIEYEDGLRTYIMPDGSMRTERVLKKAPPKPLTTPDEDVEGGMAAAAAIFIIGILSLAFLMLVL